MTTTHTTTAADPVDLCAYLAQLTPTQHAQIDTELIAFARAIPDLGDLAEIVEGPYVPGDLKMHALTVTSADAA